MSALPADPRNLIDNCGSAGRIPPPYLSKEGLGENGESLTLFRMSTRTIFLHCLDTLAQPSFSIPPHPSLPKEGREFRYLLFPKRKILDYLIFNIVFLLTTLVPHEKINKSAFLNKLSNDTRGMSPLIIAFLQGHFGRGLQVLPLSYPRNNFHLYVSAPFLRAQQQILDSQK